MNDRDARLDDLEKRIAALEAGRAIDLIKHRELVRESALSLAVRILPENPQPVDVIGTAKKLMAFIGDDEGSQPLVQGLQPATSDA